MGATLKLQSTPTGVRFAVKVVPGASRERVVGVHGDALKVAVCQPPSGGAANAAVVALLAATFGVASRAVTIVSGHSTPWKQVEVAGISGPEVEAVIERVCRR